MPRLLRSLRRKGTGQFDQITDYVLYGAALVTLAIASFILLAGR